MKKNPKKTSNNDSAKRTVGQMFTALWMRVRKGMSWLNQHGFVLCMLWAALLNLLIECLGRWSVLDALLHLLGDPLLFAYNTLIILLTLSVSLLFRRRWFALTLLTLPWLIVGIINCVVLGYRDLPFCASDILLFNPALPMWMLYVGVVQWILIGLGLLVVIGGCVLLYMKSTKYPTRRKHTAALMAVMAVILTGSTFLVTALERQSASTTLADIYAEFGFVYGFSSSVFDRGVDMPDDYSQQTIGGVLEQLPQYSEIPEQTPNVIIVQLESFMDVNQLNGLTYSENPVPIFTELKEKYSTGTLTVPVAGGGTANTEFEVLTGMNVADFGIGEYPYITILKDNTCETVAYNLKNFGYASHAMHNYTGTFYDRYRVYANLGFDTFTPVEYMGNLEYNELGWARDANLNTYIAQAMASTDQPDFVFAVSVQGHGNYPAAPTGVDYPIEVFGAENEKEHNQWTYYINQAYDMDRAVGALITQLSEWQEPTVLVLYGDHLPSIGLQEEDVRSGDLYQTEYVIWSNFGLKKQDRDLTTYQLSAEVLDRLNIHAGVLTALHQTMSENGRYAQMLEMLSYDMLYGNSYAAGGENPYQPTDLQLGLQPITVSGVNTLGGALYVTGTNFNESSVVMVDGEPCETVYVDSGTLMVGDRTPAENASIAVAQVGEDGTVLGSTEARPLSNYLE